jgi:hypothetical protein
MKRNFMKRGLIGFLLGVLVTLLVQYGWQYWKVQSTKDEAMLFDAGRTLVEKSLPESKVLDVAVLSNYKESVDYVYDKMYGVEVKYERNGKVKKIIFPVSKYKGTWIYPNNTQFYALDDKAEVVYTAKPK